MYRHRGRIRVGRESYSLTGMGVAQEEFNMEMPRGFTKFISTTVQPNSRENEIDENRPLVIDQDTNFNSVSVLKNNT